ncbi:3-isopropylmalate dehydrogenase [Alicyclobacillus ferrooxydans]|uniref:3-isopropylmalate dehydrogenase n=1 Tax=Alicyclobacillus ferrooxydans TaxID=471514 RepID=A0A0P9CK01_9BACL|nr:3-isopropylmalate dehydrogenase [Alicyclobacillus ferrooxydans]KPV45593.1 3-isopropylmalate dehydrogenase [Alicyclobacillus ferrooxydans]
MHAKIAVLPGDGIGPEVTTEAVALLQVVAEVYGHQFEFEQGLIGGSAIDDAGTPLPDATLALAKASQGVLLGAVGGPKWDKEPASRRPETGLLGLRKGLEVFANLRPITVFPELVDASPLKREVVDGVDMLIVRELTGGLYFGQPRGRSAGKGGIEVVDTLQYSEHEIRRILQLGFEIASQRSGNLTSVDKANVLESSRVWRELAEAMAVDYPGVTLSHQLVDSAAMQIVQNPKRFDVVVTENLFGDILSDEAAVITGSIGLLPSASLGAGGPGIYEPIHGSAPDIAGKGVANPLATMLSCAMLLRHSLSLEVEAQVIEEAVKRVLAEGARTADLAGQSIGSTGNSPIGTQEMAKRVREAVKRVAEDRAKNAG